MPRKAGQLAHAHWLIHTAARAELGQLYRGVGVEYGHGPMVAHLQLCKLHTDFAGFWFVGNGSRFSAIISQSL